MMDRQVTFIRSLIEYLENVHTLRSEDVQALEERADIMLRSYTVRSHVPVVGPLIAWTRRSLTAPLRGSYIDDTLERQVAFNRALTAAVGILHQRVVELRLQEHYEAAISAGAVEDQIALLRRQLDEAARDVSAPPRRGLYMLVTLLLTLFPRQFIDRRTSDESSAR
jgi:hypothetical protein